MCNYFEKLHDTLRFNTIFHVVKLKRMKVKLKKSFNLLLMKMYPDFSDITQIKMCLSSINHEDEKISLLYTTEECTHVLPSKLSEINKFIILQI